MATVGTERSANLSSFLGLDNRRPDFRLRTQDGALLRAAANVDISDANTAKRRKGSTLAQAGSHCHSLWANPATGVGYYVDGGTLYKLTTPPRGDPTRTALATGLADRPLSYAAFDNEVVFSDGLILRTIVDNAVRAFGMPVPAETPRVYYYGAGTGSLPAGVYLFCWAYRNAWSELSGTSDVASIEVLENDSITVTTPHAPWPADVTELVLYMSPANTDTLYRVASFSDPNNSYTAYVLPSGLHQASTFGMVSLPPGRILRYWGGRLYSANGDTLWFSRPYSPALCSPARDYVQFDAPVTVVEPCDDGLFIVADKTYWLGGDPEHATLKTINSNRGVLGSSGTFVSDRVAKCFWMSDHGLVVGSSGAVELVQDEHVFMPLAAAGASLFRESDGVRQVMSSVFGANQSVTAASSFMDAEVVRKGTKK